MFSLFKKKQVQHVQQQVHQQQHPPESPQEQIYHIHPQQHQQSQHPAGIITKDTTIGDIVQQYPEAVEPLMAAGVHCVGCHVSPSETLEQGLKGHGMSDATMQAVLQKLNEAVQKKQLAPKSITLTTAAASRIIELAKAKNAQGLRVAVLPGGCSGFQYEFELESTQQANDMLVEEKGAKVFVQPSTMEMIKGSQLDYLDSLQGAGFKIQNPQAKSTCGCGSSFS